MVLLGEIHQFGALFGPVLVKMSFSWEYIFSVCLENEFELDFGSDRVNQMATAGSKITIIAVNFQSQLADESSYSGLPSG